jgi:cytidylate kinase
MTGERLSLVDHQVLRWALERRAASEEAARSGRPAAVRPVITVSRGLGSGGTEVAETVARRLKFHLFDREIIDRVATEAGVHQHLVEALDEGTRSGIEQWMEGVLHSRIFTAEEFIPALGRGFITMARAGSAVIMGRGANFFLAGEPALHLRMVAPMEYRVARVMRVLGIGRKDAEKEVRRADRDRTRFVERYLRRDIDDPTSYHLVLNLEVVGLDQAVDTVISLYHALYPER